MCKYCLTDENGEINIWDDEGTDIFHTELALGIGFTYGISMAISGYWDKAPSFRIHEWERDGKEDYSSYDLFYERYFPIRFCPVCGAELIEKELYEEVLKKYEECKEEEE